MATFAMVGKKLEANWLPGFELFRKNLEANGIMTAKGTFFPKDGKKFYDNLETAFSNSTLIHVEKISRFADNSPGFMTVYDKDGNPVV